jgi:integrase
MAQETPREARIAELEQLVAESKAELVRLKSESKTKKPRHRQIYRLTVRRLKEIVDKRIVGFHADGGNLYFDFKSPPSTNWVFRYKRNGVAHDMGLGSWPMVSLAEARAAVEEYRKKLRAGIDPLAERRAARAAARAERTKVMTFEQGGKAYIKAFEVKWTNARHAAQWTSSLEAYVYPTIGSLPIATIDTALVMKVLEPIWYIIPETASRVRQRGEKITGWAITAGYRPDGDNPWRWRGHLENLLPARSATASGKHHPAMPYTELPAFMVRLAQEDGIGVLALRIAILTCLRTNELLGAKWDEFDLTLKVWIVPAERMKRPREHRIPLAEPVLEILRELKKLSPSEFVFATHPRRPVAGGIMLETLRRMGEAEATVHGFRSTFSDWCAERTNFPSELREMTLAHAVGNKVEAAYRRGDLFQKRRQLMDAWARYATSPPPAGEVVAIGKGRSLG